MNRKGPHLVYMSTDDMQRWRELNALLTKWTPLRVAYWIFLVLTILSLIACVLCLTSFFISIFISRVFGIEKDMGVMWGLTIQTSCAIAVFLILTTICYFIDSSVTNRTFSMRRKKLFQKYNIPRNAIVRVRGDNLFATHELVEKTW